MTDKKISDLTVGGILADNDLVEFVDVSDTTQAPTGTSKKMTPVAIQDNMSSAGFIKAPQVLTRTNTDAYTPTADTHPATKGYTDDADDALQVNIDLKADDSDVLKKDGSVPLDGGYSPSADLDIATKEYVDNASSTPFTVLYAGPAGPDKTLSSAYTNFTFLEFVMLHSEGSDEYASKSFKIAVAEINFTRTYYALEDWDNGTSDGVNIGFTSTTQLNINGQNGWSQNVEIAVKIIGW